MGAWLIWIGVGIALLGVVLVYAPGLLNWFGRLPGDFRYQSGSTSVFIPLTSMIVLSIVVSVLLNIWRR